MIKRIGIACAAVASAAAVFAAGQPPKPVNVPELMRTFGGKEVKTLEDWEKVRAPELLECFEREEYGRRPVAAAERGRVSFEVYRTGEALGGKAVCKHVRVKFDGPHGKHSFPVTVYIPKAAKPVPAFVYIAIDFHTKYDRDGAVTTSDYWPVERIIDRGCATAAFPVIRVAKDNKNAGFSQGIFPAVQPAGERGGDSWATLSAWAWGASRVLDWMETEPAIDAKHVGVVGHSRGGKTAILTGATDKRFAMACSNESGCSGAKLNHIDLPKSEHLDFMMRHLHHWFCANYRKYAGKEMEMPFDQHQLLALVAPRLLCVGSATEDHWCGQLGEWWSAKLASPAWELYGKKGLVADKWPAPEKPQQEGCVSYHLRTGKHFLTPYDWDRYMDFAGRHGWNIRQGSAGQTQAEQDGPGAGWRLKWSDEFNGTQLDTNVWRRIPTGGADWDRHMSTRPDLVVVRNGVITMRGVKNEGPDKDKHPWLTGGIDNRNGPDRSLMWQGKVLIRAKFQDHQRGAWPALWMCGARPDAKGRGYPWTGEIDIVERLNGDPFVYHTVHSGWTLNKKHPNEPRHGGRGAIRKGEWNVYGMEITPTELVWSVNGKETLRYPKTDCGDPDQFPFSGPFFFLLDMQLGGKWVGKVSIDTLPVEMYIDYIRIYEKEIR